MIKQIWNLEFYYFIDLIKIGLILWGILEFKLRKNRWVYIITGFVAFLLISISGLYVEKNQSLVEAAVTIILLLTICNIFQGKINKKLVTALLVYVCIIFFDVCIAGGMSFLSGLSLGDIVSHDLLYFICNSFNIVIICIVLTIRRRKGKTFLNAGFTRKVYALLFLGAVTGVFFVGGLMLVNFQGETDRARRIVLAVIIIATFAYFAACLMLVIISESRDSYKMLSQINQTVIEAQHKYYMLANEKEQEIRSIRHEIKNHLSCINSLSNSNKLEEMRNYINQVIDHSESLEELFDTGNDIVNAILNDSQSKYLKEGIRIQLEGAFPKELMIAPIDLCVIFANAVSNAVEAIQKMMKSSGQFFPIKIKISSFKEDLFIDIGNPVADKVEITDGKLSTTKQDKKLHGFGSVNMLQRVKKYHGSIEYESKENEFIVHINMKNQ
jgi:hypothetical protein